MDIVKRGEYLKRVFNVEVGSWHLQIIELARGFSEKLFDSPRIDIAKTKQLQELRNATQYGVLSTVCATNNAS
ncbi:MAG: hypothetical protein QXO16_00495 [Archaeoglobaceae archaeon]